MVEDHHDLLLLPRNNMYIPLLTKENSKELEHFIDSLTTNSYYLFKQWIEISYERNNITEEERNDLLSQLEETSHKLLYNKNLLTKD